MTPWEIILNKLQETIGLDSRSLGDRPIESALRARMHEAGQTELEGYLALLEEDPEEFQALIEQVVVPETWFFRDEAPFALVEKIASTRWASLQPVPLVRVLCLPCSTGEEAYSIAISLVKAGLPLSSIAIDAIDISKRALEIAATGIYGPNSFRGRDPSFREQYCYNHGNGHFEVRKEIRNLVTFYRYNVINKIPTEGPYDMVFCRNLLIYLHADARQQLINAIRQRMNPYAHLFVGHAEALSLLAPHFRSFGEPGQFAYSLLGDATVTPPRAVVIQKRTAKVAAGSSDEMKAISARILARAQSGRSQRIRLLETDQAGGVHRYETALTALEGGYQAERGDDATSLLNEATDLANNGAYEQAELKCEEAISRERLSARAYCLLGSIAEAKKNEERAEDYYRRAIYLDAEHHAALVHLSLLMAKQGRQAEASLLRVRAERLD